MFLVPSVHDVKKKEFTSGCKKINTAYSEKSGSPGFQIPVLEKNQCRKKFQGMFL
jgi:hypothetical protein